MIYGQIDYHFGDILSKPEFLEGNPIRLYTLDEIITEYASLGMQVKQSFADFSGKCLTENDIQMIVCSEKQS